MQRPTGVTVLAILAAIGGVFSVLGGLTVFGFGSFYAAATGNSFFTISGLLVLALGIVYLAIAYGFWTLKPWAWTWGVVVAAVGVLIGLIQLVLGGGGITGLVIDVVVAAILIYYLNMPEIRKAFSAPEKGWPFVGNIGNM